MPEEQLVEKKVIDVNQVIQTIIIGTDWQEVLTTLVAEEGMDPMSVDIIKLAEVFTRYMAQLQKFDFRVPARFILVAAILLRMKAELLLDEEEQKALSQKEIIPLDIENVPMLLPPMTRKPTRKVTLSELVSALNKAFEFQERKEGKQLRMRRAVERLIEKEEDIEVRIDEIYREIVKLHSTTLSELVHSWRREDIVKTFLPVLHLMMRDLITVDQEEMFKEIFIKVREKAEIDGEKKT
ncbi:MAG TPA: segregation/condensation protein A [archaeon]|nr:segregation/condensation protein A [archaeon]